MKRSIEFIEKMVCYGESIESRRLHIRDRREPFNTTRQMIMTLAIESGHTMSAAGAYFDRTHATALNAKRSIYNRVETEKAFKDKFEAYRDNLRTKESLIDRIIREKLIINKANLEYCAKNEVINGSLLQSIREAMQAYHEAKMKEVTDADIEHKADDVANCESSKEFERGEWLGFKEGARAFRDGLIKHR